MQNTNESNIKNTRGKKVKVICDICNKEIEIFYSKYIRDKKHYCDKDCKAKKTRRIFETNCYNCKKKLIIPLSRYKEKKKYYCSKLCEKNSVAIKTICFNCNKELILPKHMVKRKRFCGLICKKEFTKKNNEKDCICVSCGNIFKRSNKILKNTKNTYCSVECRKKKITTNCPVCNKEFTYLPLSRKNSKNPTCSFKCMAILMSRKIEVTCIICGKKRKVSPSYVTRSENHICKGNCFKIYFRKLRLENPIGFIANGNYKGEKSYNWKGGKWSKEGYLMVKKNNHPYAIKGYVYQHRLVMEEELGRILNPYEHVHHINQNKSDNRLENLKLVTHKEHMNEHKIIRDNINNE